jgi:DNA-binding transcriptional MocR family regulator
MLFFDKMMILELNRNKKTPLYIQIRDRISDMIAGGFLPPGSRLPASRELADSLDISRNTVVIAYQELEAKGLIWSRVGRGTFVRKYLPHGYAAVTSPTKQKMRFEGLFSATWSRSFTPYFSSVEQLIEKNDDPETISFMSALPDKMLFPLGDFRDCLNSAMRTYGADLLASDSSRGFPPLLKFLPIFLARRNILCKDQNIMIVSGIQQGLSIVGRLFVDPGDTVVLENLTYPGALRVFRSLQANCVGVPVDSEGIRVDVLESVLKRRKVKLLYTIPTFQNPTGSILSTERRGRIVELCRENQVVIVEDDYAYEFIYEGKNMMPLKALDESGGIIYMGSFSEILFPGIRLSWILAPQVVVERLLLIKKASDLFTNCILQGAVVAFCQRGLLEKYVKKKSSVFKKRRDVMAEAITKYFPAEITWEKSRGGLFQWVELPGNMDALSVLLKARERKVSFTPDRAFSVEEWERGGFRLGFASLEEERIEIGIKILGEILKAFLVK